MKTLQAVPFRKGREYKPRLSQPYDPGKRHSRYWTDADRAVLRKYYKTGGAAACLDHLPKHRQSLSGIYQEAGKLGLTQPTRQRRPRDPELEKRVAVEWAKLDGKKRGAVTDLANRLGLDRWVLSVMARRLGLTVAHRKEPPWTQAELKLLRKVPLHNLAKCSDIFREHGYRRSESSIMSKSKRENLARRRKTDTYNCHEAAAILGLDSKTVSTMLIKGEIAARRLGTRRLPQQGGDTWAIQPAELRRYVIDSLERVDFRKVDKFALVHLLISAKKVGKR